jgi:hypothetical protein
MQVSTRNRSFEDALQGPKCYPEPIQLNTSKKLRKVPKFEDRYDPMSWFAVTPLKNQWLPLELRNLVLPCIDVCTRVGLPNQLPSECLYSLIA